MWTNHTAVVCCDKKLKPTSSRPHSTVSGHASQAQGGCSRPHPTRFDPSTSSGQVELRGVCRPVNQGWQDYFQRVAMPNAAAMPPMPIRMFQLPRSVMKGMY